MGLMDRLAKKFTPDYRAVFEPALGAEDAYVASASGFPHGYERASRSRGLDQVVLNAIVDGVANKAAAKHTSGDEDSIARRISQAGELKFVVVSTKGLSIWDLGMMGRDDPELEVFVPREAVEAFVDTGQRAQGGAVVSRLQFADGSAIAYRLSKVDEPMAAAMASFGTAEPG